MAYEVISKRDCIYDSSVVLKLSSLSISNHSIKIHHCILGITNILKYIKIENIYLKSYNILQPSIKKRPFQKHLNLTNPTFLNASVYIVYFYCIYI